MCECTQRGNALWVRVLGGDQGLLEAAFDVNALKAMIASLPEYLSMSRMNEVVQSIKAFANRSRGEVLLSDYGLRDYSDGTGWDERDDLTVQQ